MITHHFVIEHLPPPINACRIASVPFGSKHARIVDAPEYRSWKVWAHAILQLSRLELPADTYWRALILVPASSMADVDAYTKQILDALVAAKVTPDDRLLCEYSARWHSGKHLEVTVRAERPEKWVEIRRPSRDVLKRLMQLRLPLGGPSNTEPKPETKRRQK